MTILKSSHAQTAPLSRMLSVAEVATIFGRAPRTIRGWVARGLIKKVKVGNAVFIPEAEVDALIGTPDPVWSDVPEGAENSD